VEPAVSAGQLVEPVALAERLAEPVATRVEPAGQRVAWARLPELAATRLPGRVARQVELAARQVEPAARQATPRRTTLADANSTISRARRARRPGVCSR